MAAWVLEWLGSTAAAALLLGALAYLCRQQISAWLNKDLERLKAQQVQELEAKKAEYQRDLELYRTSLIAAAERTKAEAEVKKSGALRIVEKKFDCLDQLHAASLGNAVQFLRVIGLESDCKTTAEVEMLLTRCNALHAALLPAGLFLSLSERDMVIEYLNVLAAMLPASGTPAVVGEEFDGLRRNVFRCELAVDQMLRRHVETMLTME